MIQDVVDFLLTMKKWLEKLNKDFQLSQNQEVKATLEAAKACNMSLEAFSERDRSLKGLQDCLLPECVCVCVCV